jgi:glycosyltransferase involved in cell wall biosynthesis
MSETITVCVPTFLRNASFERAMRSLFAQTYRAIKIVAVDNDPQGGAMALIERLAQESPFPFAYAHEPRAGVSNARNKVMTMVATTFVLFLDDDQEAPPNWVEMHVKARAAGDYDVLWGPIRARPSDPDHPSAAWVGKLYERTGPQNAGPVDRFFGMNNGIIRRAIVLPGEAPFPEACNESGGEDDLVFSAAMRVGAKFGWSPDAYVNEYVDPQRSDVRYALRRVFAYGQGPCETAFAEKDWPRLARHMLIGAGQSLVFGAAALLAFAISSPERFDLLGKAVMGAGKVWWWQTQKFYGASQLPQG